MGLLRGLLTLPAAPLRGTVAVAEQVRRQAERDLHDPARIRRQLEEVARRREEGSISDEEATAWEDLLVARLVEGRGREEDGRG